MKESIRIAIDTGGTFTDCVWTENGRLRMLKVFSTPADPSQAIAEAIVRTGALEGEVILLHGTTVGTNTLLQRTGARVALVTTAGFEDVIEIGRQARPKLYDFNVERVRPLVPRELRFGVGERTRPDGEVEREAETQEVASLVECIRKTNPEAIAISLLFSFANSHNEKMVAEACRQLQVPVSLSHEIVPEFREYERTSTAVMNAYLQPVMEGYLSRLGERLGERFGERLGQGASQGRAKIFVMQSSGGIAPISTAMREPVRTLLSGPAGGIVGARAMAKLSGFSRILTLDMGGTSTDVALVEGEPATTCEGEIDGQPVRVPMLNIHTVGAGGGSLVRFDSAGALRVGPESAGADPGPICYGRGEQPTVTDANLLLGRLQPENFMGGEARLDLARTEAITKAWLKREGSPWTLKQFAAGVLRVVNANMEKALRVVSIEKGHDPRDYTLMAFGGAGGLHACALAEALEISTVIIPRMPGALSAYGILVSDIVKDLSQTAIQQLEKASYARLDATLRTLEKKAREEFAKESWTGAIRVQRFVDLRYCGQGFELKLPFSKGVAAAFHAEHKRHYGYDFPEREIEVVTLRLRASIRQSPVRQSPVRRTLFGQSARSHSGRPNLSKEALDSYAQRSPANGSPARRSAGNRSHPNPGGPILARASMLEGKKFRGPLIITEYSATTVVPEEWAAEVDGTGNLILRDRVLLSAGKRSRLKKR